MEIGGRAGQLIGSIFRWWTTPIYFGFRDGRFSISRSPLNEDSPGIDERIAQIDVAKTSLEAALSAIDELKTTAHRNREELNAALQRLRELHEVKAQAENQLRSVKQIAQADIDVFKQLAGVPSRADIARERLFGFLIGVAASLLASALWRFFTH